MDAKMKADMQLSVLEGMADAWAEEVDLNAMIENATSPMRLSRKAPDSVRDEFRYRMRMNIDAIVRQSFIEGAHRAVCMVQDAFKQAGVQIPQQK